MRPPEVADGVFRLGTKWANFHLVVDGDGLAVIDAGYPGYWSQLVAAVEALGRSPRDIAAVVVTRHHVDHAGTAERLRTQAGARVLVHERDAPKVSGERRSHVPPGFYRHSWRPSMARYLAHAVAAGGARYRPVGEVEPLTDAAVAAVPGGARLVETPGHTAGHCSLVLQDRGVLFAGDAMVNFDYATGTTGLSLHRFNEDRAGALTSLRTLAAFDVPTVLFGHGDPWTNGSSKAVEAAAASSMPE